MYEQVSGYFPYVLIGRLERDYVIFPDGSSIADVPGGELLYTAAGLSLWESSPGLVSRVSFDFPEEWIEKAGKMGFDSSGIKRLPTYLEHRVFYSFLPGSPNKGSKEESIFSEFIRAGLPVPRSLLGLVRKSFSADSKTERSPETLIFRDIPRSYTEARCVHFCPLDFLSHHLLPQFFSRESEKTITMQAGSGYMIPHFWVEIEHMMNGLDGFILSERQLSSLFAEHRKINYLPDRMHLLSDWGAKNVVVQCNDRSFLLWNQQDESCWMLPPYMDTALNPIGELPAFCGGFLAGLNETYDAVRSFVYGAAAASFAAECFSPFDLPGVISDLQNARIEVLMQKIQKVV